MKRVPLPCHFLLLLSVIVVALVLGAGFAMRTQTSSASTHISSSEDTFSLVAKNLKAIVVNLPPPGPSVGDLRIVTLDLYNQQGTQLVAHGDFFASLVELPTTSTQPLVFQHLFKVCRPVCRRCWAASELARQLLYLILFQ
jgi:hypothetical protein